MHPRGFQHTVGTPKFLLSLCQTPCIPSMMGMKYSTLILVHFPAGHQLREVRGCDHQSSVPAFRAETACGSAQCHQPDPTGLQRWVWVGRGAPGPPWAGRGAPLPQGPLSLVPGVPQSGEMLAVLGLSLHLLFYPRRWIWGKSGVIAPVLGGPAGCGRQGQAGHGAHIPQFVAQTSSQSRRLFLHRAKQSQIKKKKKKIRWGEQGRCVGPAVVWGALQERSLLLQPPLADLCAGRVRDVPAPSRSPGWAGGLWRGCPDSPSVSEHPRPGSS